MDRPSSPSSLEYWTPPPLTPTSSEAMPPPSLKRTDSEAMPPPPKPSDSSGLPPSPKLGDSSRTRSPPAKPEDAARFRAMESLLNLVRDQDRKVVAARKKAMEKYQDVQKQFRVWDGKEDEAMEKESGLWDEPPTATRLFEFMQFQHLVDQEGQKLLGLVDKLLQQPDLFSLQHTRNLRAMRKKLRSAASEGVLTDDDVKKAGDVADREKGGEPKASTSASPGLNRLGYTYFEDFECRYKEFKKVQAGEAEFAKTRSEYDVGTYQLLVRQMREDLTPRVDFLREYKAPFSQVQQDLIEKVYAEVHNLAQ